MLRAASSRAVVSLQGPFLRRLSTLIAAESEAEKKIAETIQQGLKAHSIRVQDASGGCGVRERWPMTGAHNSCIQ